MLKIFFILMFLPVSNVFADMKFTVLNVGEGQALLLSQDEQGVLIDVGHLGEVAGVLQKLKLKGVTRLDYFILTHLHPDHASGYFRIREAFSDSPVYDNCHELAHNVKPDTIRWVYDSLENDQLRKCLKAGDQLRFNDALISILWPKTIQGSGLNRNSLVLTIQYNKKTILVMGDVDYYVEKELIQKQQLPGNVDIVILGHHGSTGSTSQEFLNTVNPEIAVISVNKDNIRGYPSDELIQELLSRNIKVYRTDRDGDIEF